MSSPKSKAAKFFRLERTPSGVFRNIPTDYNDTLSELSGDTAVEEDRNDLSKNISATVKLKTKKITKASYKNQRPQIVKSQTTTNPNSHRPGLLHNARSLPLRYNEYDDESSSSEEEIEDEVSGDKYPFLKLLSNFEFTELVYQIYKISSVNGSRMVRMIKSSKYVSTSKEGKLHLNSFIYGTLFGLLLLMLKPVFYNSLRFMTSMALQIGLCIFAIMVIQVSISGKSKELQRLRKGSDLNESRLFHSGNGKWDPVKSSQLPLLNPVGLSSRKVPTVDLKNNYTHIQRGFSTFDDHELEEESEEDDTKSLFSVLTSHDNVYNSKLNYKSFIEQTKRSKVVT